MSWHKLANATELGVAVLMNLKPVHAVAAGVLF